MNLSKLMRVAVFLMGLIALILLSAFITLKAMTWGRTVNVPNVTSKELTVAINVLKQEGLGIRVDHEEYHPTIPAGSVINQSPQSGASVKKGRNVAVVVSLGSQEITVPDFTGEAFRRAQVTIKQVGLVLGEVARVPSESQTDTVVAQDPLPNTIMQKGGEINLLVGAEQASARLITPALTGRTASDSAVILKPLGLTLAQTGKGPVVVSQDPLAGYPVQGGKTITVTLGTRPPAPVPPPDSAAKPAAKPAEPAKAAPKTPAPKEDAKSGHDAKPPAAAPPEAAKPAPATEDRPVVAPQKPQPEKKKPASIPVPFKDL